MEWRIKLKNCVYRFFNEDDEIIYVGRTSHGVKRRINEHFGQRGHLDKECYKSVQKIDYCGFQTVAETKIYELYLINLYKPVYNTADKEHKALKLNIDIDKLKWKKYDFITIEEKELDENLKMIRMLEYQLSEEESKREKISRENIALSKKVEYLEKLVGDMCQKKEFEYKIENTQKLNLGINNRDVERIIGNSEFDHLVFYSERLYNGEVIERVEIKNIDGEPTYYFIKSGACFPSNYLSSVSMDVVNKQLTLSKMDSYIPVNASEEEFRKIKEYISKDTMKFVS